MKLKSLSVSITTLIFLSLLLSCTKKQEEVAAALSPDQLYEKGKLTFQVNCVSCHGADPKKDGPVGPSLFGSSMVLLENRVLFTKYPEGYTPKRTTALMVALPHLQKDLPALHTFLNRQ